MNNHIVQRKLVFSITWYRLEGKHYISFLFQNLQTFGCLTKLNYLFTYLKQKKTKEKKVMVLSIIRANISARVFQHELKYGKYAKFGINLEQLFHLFINMALGKY